MHTLSSTCSAANCAPATLARNLPKGGPHSHSRSLLANFHFSPSSRLAASNCQPAGHSLAARHRHIELKMAPRRHLLRKPIPLASVWASLCLASSPPAVIQHSAACNCCSSIKTVYQDSLSRQPSSAQLFAFSTPSLSPVLFYLRPNFGAFLRSQKLEKGLKK